MMFMRSKLGVIVTLLMLSCGSPDVAPRAESVPPHQLLAEPSRVDLDLVDAPMAEALRAVAEKAGINVFSDSHVDDAGHVTMSVHSASWQDALDKIAAAHQLRVEKLDVVGAVQPSVWISTLSRPAAPQTTFTGERITARFDERPIREVAKALSDVAKTRIVVDDDLQENITLHMRLPWDLALYHLAQKYDLHIVKGDGAIRIAR